MLATWLSYDDLERLVVACLTAPVVGHSVVYGVSDNTDDLVGQRLGGAPRLPAARQLRAFSRRRRGARSLRSDPNDPATQFQGGGFVSRGPYE